MQLVEMPSSSYCYVIFRVRLQGNYLKFIELLGVKRLTFVAETLVRLTVVLTSCADIIVRLADDFHAGSWNAVQLHHESCYHPRQLQLQTSTSQFIHISTPHLPTILCRCDIPRTILHIPEELHEQVCRATGADCGWEDRQVGFHWWLSHCLITQSSSVVFSPPSPRPIFTFCRMIIFNASVIGCVHVFFWLLVIFGIVLKHL